MAERGLNEVRLSEENASEVPAADNPSIKSDEDKESGEVGELSREAAPHWQMFYRSISDAVKRMRE